MTVISIAITAFISSVITSLVLYALGRKWGRALLLRGPYRHDEVLEYIASAIQEAFFVVSSDWKKVYYMSPAYEEIYGKSIDELYLNPVAWFDAIHPEDKAVIKEKTFEYVKNNLFEGFPDYRICRADGSVRWISTRLFPVMDEKGRLVRITGFAEDITERKYAEDLFNKAFFENPCNMTISDLSTGRIIEANNSWLATMEYERGEVIGHTSTGLKIYKNPEYRERIVRSVMSTGCINNVEIEFVAKNGNLKNSLFSAETVEVGGRKMMLSSGIDITEQRAAEKELRESEERFRRLAENAPDVIYRMKLPEGAYEYISPSSKMVFGYTPEEVYRRPMLVAEIIHPDWIDYFRNEWDKLLKGDVSPSYEYKIVTPEGEERWLHQRNVLIRDENGLPVTLEGIVTDITERKLLEDELLLKNAMLIAEQEVSLDGILIVGRQGELLLANRKFTEIWQIPDEPFSKGSEKEMLQYAMTLLKDPEEFSNSVASLYEHPDERCSDELFFKDGRVIERYSAPVTGVDGSYIGRVWYFRDITERKRAEEKLKRLNEKLGAMNEELQAANEEFETGNEELIATNIELEHAQYMLRESEREYRSLVENFSAGIIVYDKDETIILSNSNASRIIGLSREYMTGKPDWSSGLLPWSEYGDLLQPEQLPFQRVMSTGAPVKNAVLGLSSGRTKITKWILCDAYPDFDSSGNIIKVVVTFIDITERKKAEEEIQRLKNYMSNIIDSIPDMLIGLDPDMNITLINRKTEKASGVTMEEAIGAPVQEVLGDFAPLIKNMKKGIEERHAYSAPDYPVEKNGDRRYYNLMLYPLIANGIEGGVVRIEDVTDMHRIDEQLRQAQKMETVGNLAGGLAHDFNNVLSGIIGTASLIRYMMTKENLLNKKFTDYIDIIDRSGKRAAEMVQQLLTLSKRYEVAMRTLDLNASVRNVMQICHNTFDKSVEIVAEFSSERAMISGDPSQVEQVILNLCVNSSHAMTIMRAPGEKHGGTLTVSVRHIRADGYFCSVHPEAKPGWYWMISHNDTGVGMDEDIMRTIFDPFFTTKERSQGTGLGLAMAYSIVHHHNGFIDVYSEKGVGSSFNVYFPESSATEDIDSAGNEPAVEKGEGTALVIDDEEIVRLMGESILRECGYNVLVAESGRDGVDIFREKHDRIDVVLLDMAMPGMSGKDVYIEMKKIDPEVKVLLASGFRQDNRVDEALKLGINGFIQKPYSLGELSGRIKDIILSK